MSWRRTKGPAWIETTYGIRDDRGELVASSGRGSVYFAAEEGCYRLYSGFLRSLVAEQDQASLLTWTTESFIIFKVLRLVFDDDTTWSLSPTAKKRAMIERVLSERTPPDPCTES